MPHDSSRMRKCDIGRSPSMQQAATRIVAQRGDDGRASRPCLQRPSIRILSRAQYWRAHPRICGAGLVLTGRDGAAASLSAALLHASL